VATSPPGFNHIRAPLPPRESRSGTNASAHERAAQAYGLHEQARRGGTTFGIESASRAQIGPTVHVSPSPRCSLSTDIARPVGICCLHGRRATPTRFVTGREHRDWRATARRLRSVKDPRLRRWALATGSISTDVPGTDSCRSAADSSVGGMSAAEAHRDGRSQSPSHSMCVGSSLMSRTRSTTRVPSKICASASRSTDRVWSYAASTWSTSRSSPFGDARARCGLRRGPVRR
jgi:hypothetical protein